MSRELTLREVVEALELEVRTGEELLDRTMVGGYASDLLSDVMANAQAGYAWITLQVHQNIVAVASLKELSCVILVGNRKLDDETIEKAEADKIPILVSNLPAFDLSGALFRLFHGSEH